MNISMYSRLLHALAFLAAVVFSISAGCAGTAVVDEPGGQTVPEESRNSTTAANNTADVKSIQDAMSRIRGLPVKIDVNVVYLNRDQLKEKLKEEMDKSMPPEELAAEEKLLGALGLLKPGDNLEVLVSKMLGEEIVGYYDDETKELAIISDGAGAAMMEEITLSHEMTHALQDQNFDLLRIVPTDGTGNSDTDLARLALVEGDASLAMTAYMEDKMSTIELLSLGLGSLGATSDMTDMPAFLESQLMFPYLEGEAFVTYIKERGSWDRVNAAYQKPPESTEQILHPEKYLAGEKPVAVEVPDISGIIGTDWEPGDEEALGEFDIRTVLSENMPSSRAAEAAAGWGGGMYRYYLRPDGSMLLVMLLAWDSAGDASEFSTAMGESLQKRYGEQFVFAAGQAPVLVTPDGAWSVEQHGKNVAVVLAPDALQAKSVADLAVGL